MNSFLDRRSFLSTTSQGLSQIALLSLLAKDGLLAKPAPFRPQIAPANPHGARLTQSATPVKQVLMIFCSGACSHLDTFDYKPELIRRHGQVMPGGAGLVTFQGEQGNLTKSPWEFRPRGQCGKMISDLMPYIGDLADDLCFIHSVKGKTNTHGPGEAFMCTGNTLDGFPSMGAWLTYALGSENESLPAYVAIPDPRGAPQSSGNCWGAGFLPAAYQGTDFNTTKPVRNLRAAGGGDANSERNLRDYLQRLNRRHMQLYPGDHELAARIASYELAARMQMSIPEVCDISREPAHILKLYGVEEGPGKIASLRSAYGRHCILARRLLEQGVRFVQLFNGAYQTGGEGVSNWDGHKVLHEQYSIHGPVFDQPTAGLLRDLKQRGLLDHTLVVWCTEFGRMPTFQKGASGRDHNPSGFTCWLAGAGVKAPFSHGATDEFGYQAVQDVVTVYDLHATILSLMGLDHERLTYYHNGLERRLTDVHGEVVVPILA